MDGNLFLSIFISYIIYSRILSLAPSNTEILFELDVGDKVIGVSSFCDYPKQVVDKPTIGSWMKNEDIQRFDELSPDLILTSMYTPPSVVEWSSVNDVELV